MSSGPGQPTAQPPRPHPHPTPEGCGLWPLMQGECVPGARGARGGQLPFFPLSLYLPPPPHDRGPHSTEIDSLILGLQLSDAQIPGVLGQVFGAGEARGDLVALPLVGGGEISQQESRAVAGPLLVPVDAVKVDVVVAAQGAGQADGGSQERGHGRRLTQHGLRAASWGHRGVWAPGQSRVREGGGSRQLRGFSPVRWSRSPRRTRAQDMVRRSRVLPPGSSWNRASPLLRPPRHLPGVGPWHPWLPVAIPNFPGFAMPVGGNGRVLAFVAPALTQGKCLGRKHLPGAHSPVPRRPGWSPQGGDLRIPQRKLSPTD